MSQQDAARQQANTRNNIRVVSILPRGDRHRRRIGYSLRLAVAPFHSA